MTDELPNDRIPPRPPAPHLNFNRSMLHRVAIAVLAVLAVAGVVGTTVASMAAVNVAEQLSKETELVNRQALDLEALRADLTSAKQALVPQLQLDQRDAAATAKEAAVGKREDAVKVREDAMRAREEYVRKTSLVDGTYSVGVSMEPGTYRTNSTSSRCYWAIYVSGTNYDDIDQNDAGSTGVLTVTVADGRDFRTTNCGTWSKIG